MQNKVLNEVAIEQMDDLIKAVKGGSTGFDADGTLPELQDGEVTDPLMAVGNDGKAKKLPVKTLFGKYNIRGSGNIDLYKHHITLTSNGEKGYIDFISSNQLNCDSLQDLKTILGNNFLIQAYGVYSYRDSGDNDRFYAYAYVTATEIYCLVPHSAADGTYDNNGVPVSTNENVTWNGIIITDTVTTI